MIKNIIFDLGKVLIDYDFDIFFKACKVNSKAADLKNAASVINLFDAGKISKKQFYNAMKKIYSFQLDQLDFEAAWCNHFSQNMEMIAFAKKLSSQLNLFILSNTDEIHFPFIWQNFPILHFFDNNLMLSYQLNYIKPDLDIYKKAFTLFGLSTEESLFIDDKEKNVIAADKFGICSILHETNKKTIQEVSNLLT